ncbi:MAG: class I SAM-dependent methyltransferase [Beijerinckiaceae bacterium]|nr:class I SAM-dependent methyltransferase [Beijerinckiaceae bacterium]
MFEFVKDAVDRAEAAASSSDGLNHCLSILRDLPLDDFGLIMISMPNPDLPNLSVLLPAMASQEAQQNWTGSHGFTLLGQTNNFVRVVAQNFQAICDRPLDGARILDYGCGYGRIMRSMYYFTNPDSIVGCDPWDQSIELCKAARVPSAVELSDYLPTSLPFNSKFDLIYAFSVFTHLSMRATRMALETLQNYLTEDGLLVITIRPVEYWAIDPNVSNTDRQRLTDLHRKTGFAFLPHDRPAIDSDVTYGDTSMTLNYFEGNFPQLKVVKLDRTMLDPYQLIVFLQLRH